MSIVLKIATVDRTEWLAAGSLRYSMQLNQRSTLDCTLEDKARGYLPAVGLPIEVIKDGTKQFGGVIQKVSRMIHPGTSSAQYKVSAIDYSTICDKRLFTGHFGYQTLGAMVATVANASLTGEGISLSGVATGPVVQEKFSFNYNSVTECFNKLSQATGYLWYIDPDKVLHFSTFASSPAPFSITESSANWRDLEASTDLGEYRNRQYVRTEFNVHETFSVSVASNGVATSYFTGSFIMNSTPTVTVNGTPQTVGRLGHDGPAGAYDCFYDVNGVGVHWFVPSTLTPFAPAAGTIIITSRMDYANVALIEDEDEITARALVEGSSGRYESIMEERNIETLGALQALGAGALRNYGTVPTVITYTTQVSGLLPGHRQMITHSLLSLSGSYLIERVEVEWLEVDILEYRVTATSIERFGRPSNFLEQLIERSRIGPGPANVPDDLLVPIDASGGPVTYTLPSYTEFPGRVVRVFKIDASANVVTIVAPGAEQINSSSSVTLSQQYDSYTFQSSA